MTVLILFKTWESYSKLLLFKIDRDGNFSDSDDISIKNDKDSKKKYDIFYTIRFNIDNDDDDEMSD